MSGPKPSAAVLQGRHRAQHVADVVLRALVLDEDVAPVGVVRQLDVERVAVDAGPVGGVVDVDGAPVVGGGDRLGVRHARQHRPRRVVGHALHGEEPRVEAANQAPRELLELGRRPQLVGEADALEHGAGADAVVVGAHVHVQQRDLALLLVKADSRPPGAVPVAVLRVGLRPAVHPLVEHVEVAGLGEQVEVEVGDVLQLGGRLGRALGRAGVGEGQALRARVLAGAGVGATAPSRVGRAAATATGVEAAPASAAGRTGVIRVGWGRVHRAHLTGAAGGEREDERQEESSHRRALQASRRPRPLCAEAFCTDPAQSSSPALGWPSRIDEADEPGASSPPNSRAAPR